MWRRKYTEIKVALSSVQIDRNRIMEFLEKDAQSRKYQHIMFPINFFLEKRSFLKYCYYYQCQVCYHFTHFWFPWFQPKIVKTSIAITFGITTLQGSLQSQLIISLLTFKKIFGGGEGNQIRQGFFVLYELFVNYIIMIFKKVFYHKAKNFQPIKNYRPVFTTLQLGKSGLKRKRKEEKKNVRTITKNSSSVKTGSAI